MDVAVVAWKKAEAEVVYVRSAFELAHAEYQNVREEVSELRAKLQEVTRLEFRSPVDGKITHVIPFTGSGTVKEGDGICEVRPDPVEPSVSLTAGLDSRVNLYQPRHSEETLALADSAGAH